MTDTQSKGARKPQLTIGNSNIIPFDKFDPNKLSVVCINGKTKSGEPKKNFYINYDGKPCKFAIQDKVERLRLFKPSRYKNLAASSMSLSFSYDYKTDYEFFMGIKMALTKYIFEHEKQFFKLKKKEIKKSKGEKEYIDTPYIPKLGKIFQKDFETFSSDDNVVRMSCVSYKPDSKYKDQFTLYARLKEFDSLIQTRFYSKVDKTSKMKEIVIVDEQSGEEITDPAVIGKKYEKINMSLNECFGERSKAKPIFTIMLSQKDNKFNISLELYRAKIYEYSQQRGSEEEEVSDSDEDEEEKKETEEDEPEDSDSD